MGGHPLWLSALAASCFLSLLFDLKKLEAQESLKFKKKSQSFYYTGVAFASSVGFKTLWAFYVPNYYLFPALKATTKLASRQTSLFEVTSSLKFYFYILKLPFSPVEKVYTNLTFLILSLYLWLILFIF